MQVLAITWTAPWSVDPKQFITSAITFALHSNGVQIPTAALPLSIHTTITRGKPFTDLGIRPSMMVGGWNSDSAQKVIDNTTLGVHVSADGRRLLREDGG
jgi:hypothetical protein